MQEYSDAWKAFEGAYFKAATPEARGKVLEQRPRTEQFTPRFLHLAEKHPTDPAALDALLWVVSRTSARDPSLARAVELLERDHLRSEHLGGVCAVLWSGFDCETTSLLQVIRRKSPHPMVRAEACLALARRRDRQVWVLRKVKEGLLLARNLEEINGKPAVKALLESDPARLEAESQRLFAELINEHLTALEPEQVARMLAPLVRWESKGSERFLRLLMEKDSRRAVQGLACLTLAQMLRKRAADHARKDPEVGDRVRRQSEEMYERAVRRFADVDLPSGGTIGKAAERELSDLRRLAVGRLAPEVTGVDQDGKKLALKDYRGKVVLLDFWSRY